MALPDTEPAASAAPLQLWAIAWAGLLGHRFDVQARLARESIHAAAALISANGRCHGWAHGIPVVGYVEASVANSIQGYRQGAGRAGAALGHRSCAPAAARGFIV